MIYVSSFALNPMNNNITLHALLSVFFHAFQRHPQNIAIFIYFHRVVAAAADALSCLPFRHSQIEVKCAPHHALHVQYRSKKKEMFSLFKSAVIIIRLSAFQIEASLSMCEQQRVRRVWKIYCRIIHLIIVTLELCLCLYSSLTRKMFIMQISYSSIVYACCALWYLLLLLDVKQHLAFIFLP